MSPPGPLLCNYHLLTLLRVPLPEHPYLSDTSGVFYLQKSCHIYFQVGPQIYARL